MTKKEYLKKPMKCLCDTVCALMDDIAAQLGMSKKTLYQYYA
jgi:hypothetical protein